MMGTSDERTAGYRIARQHAGSALLEGLVMLLVGFYLFAPPAPQPGWGLSDYAAAVVVWAFRAGGLAMVGIAAMCWLGWTGALLADVLASGSVGLAFAISGAVLLAVERDLLGALIVLFGAMSLRSALGSWRDYGSTRAVPAPPAAGVAHEAPEPVVAAEPDRVDAEAKRAALQRLLLSKRRGDPAAIEPGPEPVAGEPATQPPAAIPPEIDEPRRVKLDDTPPEEGFLASFGENDD